MKKPRSPLPPIKVGTAWIDRRVNFLKIDGRLTEVRVMAVAENYVMVRFPGCMPFVIGEKEFRAGFSLKSEV